jgi:hypothetical protein
MTDLNELPLIDSLRTAVGAVNAGIDGLERAAKIAANSPLELAELLSLCLGEAAVWDQVAGSAYCHPNGFAKFVLWDAAGAPFRLRLHIWTAGSDQRERQVEQNVHGHRWNFGSAVIAGSGLQIDEYVHCDAGGEVYGSYRYRPAAADAAEPGAEYAADSSDLELVGEARLERSIRYTLGAGDSYACGTDRLHTVWPRRADLTATLVVQGPSVLADAPVYRKPEQPGQAPPEPLSDAAARLLVGATIEAVRLHAGGL